MSSNDEEEIRGVMEEGEEDEVSEVDDSSAEEAEEETKDLKSRLVPAWYDSDDETPDEKGIRSRRVNLEGNPDRKYEDRLHDNFSLIYGKTPKWADLNIVLGKGNRKLNRDSEEEDDQDTTSYKDDEDIKQRLAKGNFEIFRVVDLNSAGRQEGHLIRCVDFHPHHNLAICAGNSNTVGIYTVDGTKNPLHQNVKFDKFEIRHASFSTDGQEFYISSGLFNHFYAYDMSSGAIKKTRPCSTNSKETIRKLYPSPDGQLLVCLGHHGDIYLYSSRSKELITTLKMNGDATAVAFNSTGSRMLSVGEGQDVFCWDMERRACIAKYTDISLQYATQLATSPRHTALGMNSGFVSVYPNIVDNVPDTPAALPLNPLKNLGNLVTSVTSLKFNATGEILAMASLEKPNGVRLVHTPSMTVFPNFPFVNSNLGRLQSIAFSPNSGYMAMGSNKGIAYLFRLKKYENY